MKPISKIEGLLHYRIPEIFDCNVNYNSLRNHYYAFLWSQIWHIAWAQLGGQVLDQLADFTTKE